MDYQTADLRLSEWLAKERFSPMPADIRRIGKEILEEMRREPKLNSKGELTGDPAFESPMVRRVVKAEWMKASRERLGRAARLEAVAQNIESVEWHRGHPENEGDYFIKYLDHAVGIGQEKPEVDDPSLKVRVARWKKTKDWMFWEGLVGMAYFWAEIEGVV